MTYISLYRKYRSQDFDGLVGQEHIVVSLKNAIDASRLSHAYLFCGPRGTGKTSLARIFAKGLNCQSSPAPTSHPCGTCGNCQKIRDGHSADVIEIDAASNRGIDEIRDLREKIRFQPLESRFKVYIIDEVHMLTTEAFNALLKTLEEPPAHAVFVLATTAVQKVPATIISRCQRLDFGRIPFAKIRDHLQKICGQEGFAIDADALAMVVNYGDGSMRDALSLLDQLMSFCGKKITAEDVVVLLGTADDTLLFDLVDALAQKNFVRVFALLDKAADIGVSVAQLTASLIQHFRYLMFALAQSMDGLDLSIEKSEKIQAQARQFNLEQVKSTLKIMAQADLDMRWQSFGRVVLEVALMDIMDVLQKGQNAIAKMYQKIEIPDRVPQKEELALTDIGAGPDTPQPDTLKLVRMHWNEILDNVKSRSLFSYVSLHEGEPLEINKNGKLVVAFRKGFSFHKSRLDEQSQKQVVEEAIGQAIGRPLLIESIVTDRSEKIGVTGKPVSVDKVKEMFGGRVVS
ncbi:MAG: DNA polymerase III subunit gamma/tau [Candidatus Margulisiibacteriota bacterium]